MFGFIKKCFFMAMRFFGCNGLKCISMNNQECKVRPEIINFNSNLLLFNPYSVKISKCSGIYNNINDPYAKLYVPYVCKNMNVKLFNLIIIISKTRYIKWHETCQCKSILEASVCNNKQRWNKDKSRCELKELIDKWICDKGFYWNPSICECECYKSCNIGEYLDYKSCKYRERLADKLVEECSENTDETELHQSKMIYNSFLNNYGKICGSCAVYTVLLVVFFIISIGISRWLWNISSIYPLNLIIGKADGYIEENNGNKYLVFTSTDGNKPVLAKFTKL